MPSHRLTYRQWREPLGEVMPLAFVPQVTEMTRNDVARAVGRGEMPVHTFRGDNGRVYRMVRLVDVQRLQANPLTLKGMARAFDRMMRQPQATTRRHPARRRAA